MKLRKTTYFVVVLAIFVYAAYAAVLFSPGTSTGTISKANQEIVNVVYEEGGEIVRENFRSKRLSNFNTFRKEDLKEDFLRVHTKNWDGKVDNIRYTGFDERLHKGKNFYLDNSEEFKEFLEKQS